MQNIINKLYLPAASLLFLFLVFIAVSPVYADAATLSATASAGSVQINKTFTVRISVSADEPVTGMSACLTYESSKVELTNTSYGSWSTTAPNDGTCGSAHQVAVFSLAGSPPSSGTVATLTFRAKVSSGSAAFGITNNSQVGAQDNGANIFTGGSGDSINFTAPPSSPPPSGGGGGTPKPADDKPDEEEEKAEEEKDQEESKPDETEADDEQVIPVGNTDGSSGQSTETGAEASEEKGLPSQLMPFLLIGGAVLALAGVGFAVYKFILPRFSKTATTSAAVTGGAVIGGAAPSQSPAVNANPPQAQQPTVVAPSAGIQPVVNSQVPGNQGASPAGQEPSQPPKIQ